MPEKSINEVVKEFKAAFGAVSFRAENFETGQIGGNSEWIEQAVPKLEIDGTDFIALGHLSVGNPAPSEGVIAGLLKLVIRK